MPSLPRATTASASKATGRGTKFFHVFFGFLDLQRVNARYHEAGAAFLANQEIPLVQLILFEFERGVTQRTFDHGLTSGLLLNSLYTRPREKRNRLPASEEKLAVPERIPGPATGPL